MGTSTRAVMAVFLCLLSGSSSNQPFTAELIGMGMTSTSNEFFGDSLFEALRGEEGNLVFSPLSAQSILTMAWLGANGSTAEQLEHGVGLIPEGRYHHILGFKNLFEALKSTRTVTIDIANKLYLQEGFAINETFQEALREGFNSETQQVDFANHLNEVRAGINHWVEEKTHGKIKNMIGEGTLSEQALLVGVNALYFKGGWVKPFDEQLTATEPFHISETEVVNVPMMHQTEWFDYIVNDEVGFQAISMKYRGPNDDPSGEDLTTHMVILLPHEISDLPRVEAFVASGNISSRFLRNMAYREVAVSLPKFKIEKSLNLVPALQQLGITDLFTDGADLSGITNENIRISNIAQKAIVEVSEKGTEAAAATFMEAIPMAAIIPPVFKADHPFLFVIRDYRRMIINLFIGRVARPE